MADFFLTLYISRDNIFVMKKFLFVLMTLGALPGLANAYVERENAVLRVMNKAAGKVQEITIPVNQEVQFEKLYMNIRTCKQTDPFQAEDYWTFIEISEKDSGQIFGGWMSRNEPGQNPLQHPDYDVWLVKCK